MGPMRIGLMGPIGPMGLAYPTLNPQPYPQPQPYPLSWSSWASSLAALRMGSGSRVPMMTRGLPA